MGFASLIIQLFKQMPTQTCVHADGVVLWTRITPRTVNETTASYNVTWTVYSGADLSTVVQTGVSTTSAARDFTVKVRAAV